MGQTSVPTRACGAARRAYAIRPYEWSRATSCGAWWPRRLVLFDELEAGDGEAPVADQQRGQKAEFDQLRFVEMLADGAEIGLAEFALASRHLERETQHGALTLVQL